MLSHQPSDFYPQQKVLRLQLNIAQNARPQPNIEQSTYNVLKMYDRTIKEVVGEEPVERMVCCKLCGDKSGLFFVGEGFQPKEDSVLYCTKGHQWDPNLMDVTETPVSEDGPNRNSRRSQQLNFENNTMVFYGPAFNFRN